MRKISLVLLGLLFASLAVCGYKSDKVTSCYECGIWLLRTDTPPNLNTPEMRKMISEINAQIPSVKTVAAWTNPQMAEATQKIKQIR